MSDPASFEQQSGYSASQGLWFAWFYLQFLLRGQYRKRPIEFSPGAHSQQSPSPKPRLPSGAGISPRTAGPCCLVISLICPVAVAINCSSDAAVAQLSELHIRDAEARAAFGFRLEAGAPRCRQAQACRATGAPHRQFPLLLYPTVNVRDEDEDHPGAAILYMPNRDAIRHRLQLLALGPATGAAASRLVD